MFVFLKHGIIDVDESELHVDSGRMHVRISTEGVGQQLDLGLRGVACSMLRMRARMG